MRIVVLGAGLVGNAIVRDLAVDFSVSAVDFSQEALYRLKDVSNVETQQVDLRDAQSVAKVVAPADLVVCAVPSWMGIETLKSVILAGKNVVDISFLPEDPFVLDELAREKGVTVIVDCGVAPGLCNIQAGYVASLVKSLTRYECYVGGLPVVRQWPYEYKAVFSPADVIEEYTRPARYIENGKLVVKPALTDVETMDFPGAGTLEAFNTDGLRTLATTLDAPDMKEKTLRYPGHANLMRIFREGGFFEQKPVEINGQMVVPLDLTSKLIFDDWKMQEGEEDFTVMKVVIEGDGQRYTFDLFDHFDRENQISSMARSTGYTATAVARLVAEGKYTAVGVSPPEYLGKQAGFYEAVVALLAERNVVVNQKIEDMN